MSASIQVTNDNSTAVNFDDVEEQVKNVPRECIECDGPDCNKTNPRHRCSRCHCSFYCSAECQKKDWKNHKPYCIPIEQMREKHLKNQPQTSCSNNNNNNNNNDSDKASPRNTTMQNTTENSPLLASSSISTPDSISIIGEDYKLETSITGVASSAECPICLEVPTKNVVVHKQCNHGFCSACIIQWQQYNKTMADLYIDFADEDSEGTSKRPVMICPYCRTEAGENMENKLMQKAVFLATRALSDKVKPDKATKDALLKEAVDTLNIVLETNNPVISAYFSKAEFLLELDDPSGAVKSLKALLQADAERKEHPVMKLLNEQEEAVKQFDRNKYERLKVEVVDAVEEHGLPPTRLRNDGYFDVYMLLAQSYEKLDQWRAAVATYRNIFLMDEEQLSGTSPIKQRQLYYGLGKSLHYDKQYEKSIELLDAAITMNRHYPGVHKYQALSQKELGNLVEAVKVMNRAVLYESPWDDGNRLENLQLYRNLLQNTI